MAVSQTMTNVGRRPNTARTTSQNKQSTILFKTDLSSPLIRFCFQKRGWQETSGRNWNIIWATVGTAKNILSAEKAVRLTDQQLVNHFPNHYELTRKDLMVKNLKRYSKEIRKNCIPSTDTFFDFVPTTYSLPSDYTLFVEEFKKSPDAMWIMKPSGKAQGKGIFIITKLSQIKKWSRRLSGDDRATSGGAESYVVSRYIHNPLLIGGKKFDLRLYVLVTSYRPLKAYLHREGFARFSTVKYTTDLGEIGNPFIHLTNVSIQKKNREYNSLHGGKWSVQNLRLFIESQLGKEAVEQLFSRINLLIVHSLRAVQGVMIADPHCFECYGYDIIIDDTLRPWLVEVNASPSLSPSTPADRIVKCKLIKDILEIVLPSERELSWTSSSDNPSLNDKLKGGSGINGFSLLMDENRTSTKRPGSKRDSISSWR